MKILFVGHGRCGKDTACEIAADLTYLRNAGTFSKYLTPYVAFRLGVSEEVAYAERHQNREVWMDTGNQVRKDDPTAICRMAFANGDVSGGVRGLPEIVAIRDKRIADLIVWIDRDVPADPTLEFGPEYADLRVSNAGTVEEFRDRLRHLFGLLGILK